MKGANVEPVTYEEVEQMSLALIKRLLNPEHGSMPVAHCQVLAALIDLAKRAGEMSERHPADRRRSARDEG